MFNSSGMSMLLVELKRAVCQCYAFYSMKWWETGVWQAIGALDADELAKRRNAACFVRGGKGNNHHSNIRIVQSLAQLG